MAAKKKSIKKKTEEQSVFSLQETPPERESSPRRFYFNKTLLAAICILLTAIIILAITLHYYLQQQKNQQLQKNPLLASEKEQESVVANVAKIIQLPNELPTIAKVSDITKLQGQPFFQKAKNGDYLLVYAKAQEAILYDPTDNKIIQMGPISLNQSVQGASTAGEQQVPAAVTVAVYNGTQIAGLAKRTEQQLADKMPNMTVVEETNASSSAYTQTKVIDLTGNNAVVAQHLATLLNGIVTKLPRAEVKPIHADLLVILGSK